LYDTPENAVVVENEFGKLSGRDIHRLQPGSWLNDEIINYYNLMVRERSLRPETMVNSRTTRTTAKEFPRVHVFNTFFYSLLSSRGYPGVRRWTKKAKVNLFEMDRVIIPINKGGLHWVLCVINVTQKRIEYYDSLASEGVSNDNRAVLENVKMFMQEEAKAQKMSADDVAQWTFHVPVLYPLT
jgi:sentrin-specific protease 1